MQVNSASIDVGCFYQINAERWIKSEVDIQPTGKITLFSNIPVAEQQQQIEQLSLSLDFSHYIKQCKSKSEFVFWELVGDYEAIDELSNLLKQLPDFDYLVWPNSQFSAPQLILFDMDSTFIEIEVIDELAKCHGVGEQVSAVTESAMRGELDFAQSLVSRVACLKGLSTQAIEKIADSLPVSRGVAELVQRAAANSCKIAIVSGGFMPFVERLKQQMDLYKVHANRLKIKDGALIGEVEGDIVDAHAKADFLTQLCTELELEKHQVMAIGDGANDLLMMQEAGMNLAYRAKPAVVAQARGRLESCHLGQLVDIFSW